jgi:hypothetical protein
MMYKTVEYLLKEKYPSIRFPIKYLQGDFDCSYNQIY